MASFNVNENFQFGGGVQRAGLILDVGDSMVITECEKGLHKSGKPLSGLLNHCSPADEATAKLVAKYLKGAKAGKEEKAELSDKEKAEIAAKEEEEIVSIQKEMDELGKAYDKRWGIKRFRDEVIKARKESAN
jgi:hypothetical protein